MQPIGADIKVFISHAHVDVDSASALVQLLESYLTLRASEIRCTSVVGYGIRNGEGIADRLRNDLDATVVVIGLLSEEALQSPWVSFELGAAWGRRMPVILVLGPGISYDDRRLGPLGQISLISVDSDDAAEKLSFSLHQVGTSIGRDQYPTGAHTKGCRDFVETFRRLGGATQNFAGITVTFQGKVQVKVGSPHVNGRVKVEGAFPIGWDGFIWMCSSSTADDVIWPKRTDISCTRGVLPFHYLEGGVIGKGGVLPQIIGVGRAGNRKIENWLANGERNDQWPTLRLRDLPGAIVLDTAGEFERLK